MTDYRLDPLWLKLNMMNAEGLTAFAPLAQALQTQLGYNAAAAQRIIEEYRKFLFLAMRAGHQVIPPGIVNDAWLMHIENVQDYWETLGGMISERPLAHGLGTAGGAPAADAWKATLDSYERIFGAKPPMDIWGGGPDVANPWMRAMAMMRRFFARG
ncbi:MAG: hypothetical protein ACKOED_10295 [Aestuariivirga sp.]|uniref:hypothetical protein n=1 Tax=Aestuariivirga sp. TaxID=2650926 RepID=UPI0038D144C8